MRAVKKSLGAVAAVFAVLVSLVALAPSAGAASMTISSAGPLDQIIIGDDLSCQVSHVDDAAYEFFPPGDSQGSCGTFVYAYDDGPGIIYGPPIQAYADPTVWTPISQSAVTGSGTPADPYTVVTEVSNGGPSLRVVETDTYVVGDQFYTTEVEVRNTSGSTHNYRIFRAGDCYLNDSDDGFGAQQVYPDGTAVACVGSSDGGVSPNNRIEQWVPLTTGSTYMEGLWTDVWDAVLTGTLFTNTDDNNLFQDNGAGLSWEFLAVPSGESRTVSHQTQFVPSNVLSFDKEASTATSVTGGQNGYTVSITNSTAEAQVIDSITDTLPDGFSYVTGTTSGEFTDEPTLSGQDLTWDGPFAINAGETIEFSFDVTVANTPGTYCNDVTGVSDATVLGAEQVACIDVTNPPTTTTTTLPVTPVTTAAVVTATPQFTG